MTDPTPAMQSGSPARTRTSLSNRKKAVLALFLAGFCALMIDNLFRGYLMSQGQPWSPTQQRKQLNDGYESLTQRVPGTQGDGQGDDGAPAAVLKDIAAPYTGFDIPHHLEKLSNEIEYYRSGKNERDFNIAVVGGSVAAGFCNKPKQFIDPLKEQPFFKNRRVRLMSYARGSFKQPQQVGALGHVLSLGLIPDVVINIDGFNELAVAAYNFANDVHPLQPSVTIWSKVIDARNEESEAHLLQAKILQRDAAQLFEASYPSPMMLSAVFGYWSVAHMRRIKTDYAARVDLYTKSMISTSSQRRVDVDRSQALKGPVMPEDWDANMDLMIEAWERSSITLKGMCDAHSIAYLHVLQPTLHDEGSKTLTEQEISTSGAHPSWIRSVKSGYPRLRERSHALIDKGIHFADLSMAFQDVEETVYYDPCHFNRGIGADIFGRAVAEAMRAIVK